MNQRLKQDAEIVRQQEKTVIWFIWFVSSVWLHKTNQMNETDQMNPSRQSRSAALLGMHHS